MVRAGRLEKARPGIVLIDRERKSLKHGHKEIREPGLLYSSRSSPSSLSMTIETTLISVLQPLSCHEREREREKERERKREREREREERLTVVEGSRARRKRRVVLEREGLLLVP